MPIDLRIHQPAAQESHDRLSSSGDIQRTGTFMGREAVQVASPMSLLADAAEELTFTVDTTKEFELAERKERKSMSESMLKRVQLYKDLMHKSGKTDNMKRFTEMLRGWLKRDQILEQAARYFPDPSDAWTALADALETLEQDSAVERGVLEEIRSAMTELEHTAGPAIRAGIQGALQAGDFADIGTPEELRGLYRRTVCEFEDVNDVFAHILSQYGEAGFEEAMDFLFRALGSDLGADVPSMDMTHLESVHADLGRVRLLQSAHTLCDRMLLRWEQVHGVSGVRDDSLKPMDLLGEIIGLRNERFLGAMHIDRIAARSKAPDIEHEVLFLQELLSIIRSFPSQLFDDDQGRMKVLDAVQESVDNAIAREDEFLAAQEEGNHAGS